MTDKALLTTDQQEVGTVYCSYHFVENTSCIQWNLRKMYTCTIWSIILSCILKLV